MSIIKNLFNKRRGRTYRSMNDDNFIQISNGGGDYITLPDGTIIGNSSNIKKIVKPIDVWNTLKNEAQPIIDCTNLDYKIKKINERIKILSDYTSELNDEYVCLGYLKARLRYKKYNKLFAYPTTNEVMINNLCKEYKLKIVSIKQYSGLLPKEAVIELKKFTDSCLKIRRDNPIIRLVVEDIPQTEKKKKDPILLASSPFGNWDYILGAWDKEVEIVDDLIYLGK